MKDETATGVLLKKMLKTIIIPEKAENLRIMSGMVEVNIGFSCATSLKAYLSLPASGEI